MYSEKPILHAYSGSHDPVAKYHAGITVKAENPMEIAAAIRRFHDMSAEVRAAMGKNGRIGAENEYDYAKLSLRLEEVLIR
jgi:hypothetical protein